MLAWLKPKRGKWLFSRVRSIFRINNGEQIDDRKQWSFPNLHDPGVVNALRALRGYEALIGDGQPDSRGKNLAAASVTSAFVYLVLDCPTTEEACERLRVMRTVHRAVPDASREMGLTPTERCHRAPCCDCDWESDCVISQSRVITTP